MPTTPDLAIEMLRLYRGADIHITASGDIQLTPFATGQIVTMLAALDPEAGQLLLQILQKLEDTLAMKVVRDQHAKDMAKPNYCAGLKAALCVH